MSITRKVSLKDIAEAAGVSVSLVSFVLSNRWKEHRVSPETACHIQSIAKEMNYEPNFAAISLRSGKTKTIGLVVSDIANPFFSQIARELENQAEKIDNVVLFGSSDEKADRMEKVMQNLIKKGVDGLIIVPTEQSHDAILKLYGRKIPMVLLDRYFEDLPIDYVALDNFEASYRATSYLLEKGYSHPCVIAYSMNLINMQERVRGYQQAMIDAGKSNDIQIEYVDREERETIIPLISKQLDKGTDGFLFTTNMIAIQCLYQLEKVQKQTSRSLGLVGFDETPVYDFFSSPVAYVKQPIDVLVTKALELLTDKMNKEKKSTSQLVPAELVETLAKN